MTWPLWVALVQTFITGIFAVVAIRAGREKAKLPSPIEDMATVKNEALSMMNTIKAELAEANEKIDKLEIERVEDKKMIRRLEYEVEKLRDQVRTLGGEVAHLNGK